MQQSLKHAMTVEGSVMGTESRLERTRRRSAGESEARKNVRAECQFDVPCGGSGNMRGGSAAPSSEYSPTKSSSLLFQKRFA